MTDRKSSKALATTASEIMSIAKHGGPAPRVSEWERVDPVRPRGAPSVRNYAPVRYFARSCSPNPIAL